MNTLDAASPRLPLLTVRFTEEMIRRYGGEGRHIHSDIECARAQGFEGLVVWGTLVLLPFSLLLSSQLGDSCLLGCRLEQRLLKPVLAAQAITYTFAECRQEGMHTLMSLAATNEAGQAVATTVALVPISLDQPEDRP